MEKGADYAKNEIQRLDRMLAKVNCPLIFQSVSFWYYLDQKPFVVVNLFSEVELLFLCPYAVKFVKILVIEWLFRAMSNER